MTTDDPHNLSEEARLPRLGIAAFFAGKFGIREGFLSALREVEKYPTIVGFEPGSLALIAKALTNFSEITDEKMNGDRDLRTKFVILWGLVEWIIWYKPNRRTRFSEARSLLHNSITRIMCEPG